MNYEKLTDTLIRLSKNGWNISNEDSKLIARSPIINNCRYWLDVIKHTAQVEDTKNTEIKRCDVSFEVVSRKSFVRGRLN